MKRHRYRANGSEFADLNVAATFRQCRSPIVSKLLTRDKQVRPLGKTMDNIIHYIIHGKTNPRISVGFKRLRWWAGLYLWLEKL